MTDIAEIRQRWETHTSSKVTTQYYDASNFNMRDENPYLYAYNFTNMVTEWERNIRTKNLKVSKSCLLKPVPRMLNRPKFNETSFCYSSKNKTRLKLVVVIFSDVTASARRRMIRDLLKFLGKSVISTMDIEYFFVLGLTPTDEVLKEIESTNDILLLDVLGSRQLRAFRSFALYDHLIKSLCPTFDILLQLTDSVFIIPEKFSFFMTQLNTINRKNLTFLYAGFPIFDHRTRLEKARKEAINRDSLPSIKRFPPHIHSSFLMISKSNLQTVLECKEPCFDQNDAAYVGYCLKVSGLSCHTKDCRHSSIDFQKNSS